MASVWTRDVGRALLTAVSRYAERQGCEHLTSAVPAGDREANRFFARLGFAPETVRRVASAATLQRKLSGESRSPRASLDLLQRRRDLRARAPRHDPQNAGEAPGAASRSRHVIRDVQTRRSSSSVTTTS